MIRWLLNKLMKWVWDFNRDGSRSRAVLALGEESSNAIPKLRIGIVQGMNGRVLEVSTHKPNPHGSDWTYEFFVLQEDQKVSDAVAMVLLMKGLDK